MDSTSNKLSSSPTSPKEVSISEESSIDLEDGLDSILRRAPSSERARVQPNPSLEEALEMERFIREKKKEGELEQERNTLEVSQGIFRTKSTLQFDPTPNPEPNPDITPTTDPNPSLGSIPGIEPNLKSESTPKVVSNVEGHSPSSSEKDAMRRRYLAETKGKIGILTDLRQKCPHLSVIRAEKPKISAAAKKFLPIGNETRIVLLFFLPCKLFSFSFPSQIPTKSELFLTEAIQFFEMPQDRIDAIARKLVVRVRNDFLMGNHGVFVAENEYIEEGTDLSLRSFYTPSFTLIPL